MFSHICCKCMSQIFHLFQTYVAFKCFMLHVFLAVWRVGGHGGVMVAGHGCRRMGRGEPMTGGCGAWHAGGWRSGARRGEVRLRGGANGWVRGAWMGASRIEADGWIASESYERDDDAMRMHVGRVSGRGAGCAGACGKWPSDGIISRRTSRRQHVP